LAEVRLPFGEIGRVAEKPFRGGHVNKAQLVEALAERLGDDKKRASATLEAFLDTLYRTVQKGEKVAITGFGVFEKRDRAARIARNPATGEKVRVKKTSVPAFRAGQEFKNVVSGAKKLPKVAAAKAPAKATTTRSTAAKAAPAKATKATKAPAKTATKTAAKSTTARKTTTTRRSPAKKA
jgi:DNA-binding protein HU-beta